MPDAPPRTHRTDRAAQIVAAARSLLTESGPTALTMRRVGERLGIRAPSLYKHLPAKDAIRVALVEQGLVEMGTALWAELARDRPTGTTAPTFRLLTAYRAAALSEPELYRLCTAGPLPRAELPVGLEDWAGEPFLWVTGEPHRAQALWSLAHGLVILELDDRFPPGTDLGRTWREAAAAFGGEASTSPGGVGGTVRSRTARRGTHDA